MERAIPILPVDDLKAEGRVFLQVDSADAYYMGPVT